MLGAPEGEVADPEPYVEPTGVPSPQATKSAAGCTAGMLWAILVVAASQAALLALLGSALWCVVRLAQLLA